MILLVEDEKSIGEMLVYYLVKVKEKKEVFWVQDVPEALLFLKRHQPALILLDYILAQGDSQEIANFVHKTTPKPELILVTAAQITEKIIENIKADSVIKKPFLLEDIDVIIEKH